MATAATANYTQAKEFAIARCNQQHHFTLSGFMDEIHRMFYSHVDMSFKDYFMEIVEQEGQFVVHHSKLIEYGVVTSDRSSVINVKLNALGMLEGEDYMLHSTVQHRKNGSSHPVNSYMLTPESFKKCLIRSRRHAGQPVDPVIYSDYFLLLEKMVKLYSMYELTKKDAEIASRDQRIADMFASMHLRDEEFKRDMQRRDVEAKQRDVEFKQALAEAREEAKQERAQIINKVDEVTEKLDDANEKLDYTTEMLEEAKEDAELIKEKLDEANEKLDVAEFARNEAEKARDAEAEAQVQQMIVAGALAEDPGLRHVGCVVTRRNDEGVMEVNFIGRQLKSFTRAIKDLEKLGYTQATPMFFTVDPIALRGATAVKNKEDVQSILNIFDETLTRMTNRILVKMGKAPSGVIVPRIGNQKSYIPRGSWFGLRAFLKNMEIMLKQTTGMDLKTAAAKADYELERMQARVYDADAGAM